MTSSFAYDSEMVKMTNGELMWGDILCPRINAPETDLDRLMNAFMAHDAAVDAEIAQALLELAEQDINAIISVTEIAEIEAEMLAELESERLQGELDKFDDEEWTMPVLNLRKDIWENFPVNVKPLGTGRDGAERHAVEWHRKNLREWREKSFEEGGPENYDVWMDYQTVQERRLMVALGCSSRWIIESATCDDQICILRMIFSESAEASVVAPPPVARTYTHRVARLNCLNDIKEFYPVVWKKIEGTNTVALELYGKKIREISDSMGCDQTETIREGLLDALRTSDAWRVLRGVGGREVCRLEMA